MNKNNYKHLIGKSKQDILEVLGDGFNFYLDDGWVYEIRKTWWGKTTVLLLDFQENSLEKIELYHYYRLK